GERDDPDPTRLCTGGHRSKESVRRPCRNAERISRNTAGRTPPDHRSEWRRQDHPVQSDQRRHAAEFGTDQVVRHGCYAVCALPTRPFWTIANLPDHYAVHWRYARTQCDARPARLAAFALADVAAVVVLRRSRNRSVPDPRRSRTVAPGRLSGVRNCLWRKAPRGA